MKRRSQKKRKHGALIIPVLMVLLMSSYAWGDVGSLESGKQSFENKCGTCHSLKDPLTSTKSKAEWRGVVRSMVTYGARLNNMERENVASYLSARSTFTTYCSTCHDLKQVVTDDAAKRNWQLTIDQMTNHFKDLTAKGMTKGKKQITANEKKSIADLLTVLLGEE